MRPEVIEGDVREVLKTFDDESVQCVVTSPPYYGLRDYGFDGQLGLEETPEEYVNNMVDVFKEVKRVLRKDGTVWLNLGDSYTSTAQGTFNTPSPIQSGEASQARANYRPFTGLKPKDLVGVPWRVAFALQADGWYLRSDIIWAKGSCMPESVTDRPTKSHEYIFLLTKSQKYYYDYEAIKEKGVYPAGTKGAKGSVERFSTDLVNSRPPEYKIYDGTRNKRSVWKMNPQPFKGAHFATFPEELPEICIKAGTSKAGCCADCGAPVERISEKVGTVNQKWGKQDKVDASRNDSAEGSGLRTGDVNVYQTKGWEPTCDCNAEKVPCVVLDIFAGSGTTLRVASKLGRKGIGIELNPEYIKILKKRCKIESTSLEEF